MKCIQKKGKNCIFVLFRSADLTCAARAKHSADTLRRRKVLMRNSKTKKLTALVLALALLIGSAVTTFAADGDGSSGAA